MQEASSKIQEAKLELISTKANLNKTRAISFIQDEESLEYFQSEEIKYESVEPQVVQNEHNSISENCVIFQPEMYTGITNTGFIIEEIQESIFSYTVSENANISVREEYLSVPVLLQEATVKISVLTKFF